MAWYGADDHIYDHMYCLTSRNLSEPDILSHRQNDEIFCIYVIDATFIQKWTMVLRMILKRAISLNWGMVKRVRYIERLSNIIFVNCETQSPDSCAGFYLHRVGSPIPDFRFPTKPPNTASIVHRLYIRQDRRYCHILSRMRSFNISHKYLAWEKDYGRINFSTLMRKKKNINNNKRENVKYKQKK